MVGPAQYTRQVVKEAKRVRWPKSNVFFVTMLTVVIVSVFFALLLTLEDLAAGTLLKQLQEAFKGLGGK